MAHLPNGPPRPDFRRRPYHLPPPPPPYYPPPRYDYERRDYRDRDRDSYIASYDEGFRRGVSRFESHPANTHLPRRPVDAWVPNQEYAEKERQEREKRAKELTTEGPSNPAVVPSVSVNANSGSGDRAKEDGEDDSNSVRSRETRPRDDRHYVPPPHRFDDRPRGRSRSPGWRPRAGTYIPDYYPRSRSRSPPPRRGYDYPPPRRRSPPRYRRRSISPVAPLRGRPPPRRRSRHPSRSTTLSRSRSRSFSRSPRSRSRSHSPPRSSMFRLGNNRSPQRSRHPSPPPLVSERPMEPRALSNNNNNNHRPTETPVVSSQPPPAPQAQVANEVSSETPSAISQQPQPEPEPVLAPPSVDKGKQKASDQPDDVVMAEPLPVPAQTQPPTAPVLLLPRSLQSKTAKPLPKGPRSQLQPSIPFAPRPVAAQSPSVSAIPISKPSFPAGPPSKPATPAPVSKPSPIVPLSASLPPKPTIDVLAPSIQRKPSALDSPMHAQTRSPMHISSPHSRTQSPAQFHPAPAPIPSPLVQHEEARITTPTQNLTTNEELNAFLLEMKISKPIYIPPSETEPEQYARLGYPENHWIHVQHTRAIAKKISDRVPERRRKQMEKRQAYFELEMAMLDVKCAERRTKASGTVLSMLLDEGDVGIM